MRTLIIFILVALCTLPAAAAVFTFSTGDATNFIGMAARPDAAGKTEIEAADDFVVPLPVLLNSATFTGLLTGGAATADIGQVVVEIYRVFPFDSDVTRTSGAPTFSTSKVPTRVNSPSDVELVGRDSSLGELTLAASLLNPSFDALNSVLNGINPKPGQTTGGEGSITGQEIMLSVDFASPIFLAPGHYFFVPKVEVTTANGNFFWLSGTRPIVAPGTPFAPDLQAWMRNGALDPDWLRVGTDIIGGSPAPTFNGAFTLNGDTVPEPGTFLLLAGGMALVLSRKLQKM